METHLLVDYVSELPFQATVERLLGALAAAGMTIFAQIDHANAARAVGLEMLPTLVLIYGNPRGGTPVMLASPRAALELPLRLLIREDASGQVMVSYRPIVAMLAQLGTPDALASTLSPAQDILLAILEA